MAVIPIDAYTGEAQKKKAPVPGQPTYPNQYPGQPTAMAPVSAMPRTVTTTTPTAPDPNPSAPPRPAGPTPSTAPTLPGTGTQSFGPQGDLRGTQIAPTGFNRPQAIGQYAGQFRGQLAPGQVNFQGVDTTLNAGAAVNPNDSAALSRYRDLLGHSADALGTGTSRSQIARDQLQAFDLESQPQIRDQIRAVGQQAAKFGRLGMGDTAVETLRPYTDYLTNRDALSHRLAAETASGEISDRLANVGQFSNLVGQEEGIGASRRNELRGERDYSTQVADTNIGRAIGERDARTAVDTGNVSRSYDANRTALDAALGQTGAQAADESGQRNELRGERDYQSQVAQQALIDAILQHQQENSDYNDQFNQNATLAGLGLGGSGAQPFLNASGQASASGAQDIAGLSDLLAQYYARQKKEQS